MYSRAASSVFWPNMRQDIVNLRAACPSFACISHSNPAHRPVILSNPVMYFFKKKDDSYHVIEVLRDYAAIWGIPDLLTSDGASVFVSQEMQVLLTRVRKLE